MKYYLDIPFILPDNVQRTFDLNVLKGETVDIPLLVWIHGGGWMGGEGRISGDYGRDSRL